MINRYDVNHMEGVLYNQAEAILSQYELELFKVNKGRGSYICETDKGIKLMTAFRGSNEKGMVLKYFLEQLFLHNFPVEQILPNKEGAVITQDEMTGECFLVKDYISGRELDTGNIEELQAAVILLAAYHQTAEQVWLEMPDKIKENDGQVVDKRSRHKKELIKVRNYIRTKKKKNEFEQTFMTALPQMLGIVEKSLEVLEEGKKAPGIFCHGDVNQHNILYENGKWHLVNFENFSYGWKMLDLANFLRKIMEKNDWDVNIGLELVRCYRDTAGFQPEEAEQLYGLLLFPEKFWKITNHYMNTRKSWISERDIEKIKKVIGQEEKRLGFMENLFSFLQ